MTPTIWFVNRKMCTDNKSFYYINDGQNGTNIV